MINMVTAIINGFIQVYAWLKARQELQLRAVERARKAETSLLWKGTRGGKLMLREEWRCFLLAS